jgi:parallel beta-helix repeat protein
VSLSIQAFLKLVVLLVLMSLPAATLAQTMHVEGPDGLRSALSAAPPGSTILLAPGDYGALVLRHDIAAAVIRSADRTRPARFSSATVDGVEGLSFENLLFDYSYSPGDRHSARPFAWHNSRNLTLRGNVFDGDAARGLSAAENGYGYAVGLSVQGSSGVLVEDNEVFGFLRGMHFRDCVGLAVRGNDLHGIRSDGMSFAQVADAVIERNHIHNFHRSLSSGDHSDMIQFWSNRTDWPSRDIVIRGNLLNSGRGAFTQSIFMRNERADRAGSRDRSLFYRNILIEENIIINAHLHGISVGETEGLVIRNNTVVQNVRSAGENPGRALWIPTIRTSGASRDVRIEGNIVAAVNGYEGQPDWQVRGNLVLAPANYGEVFVGLPGGDPARVESFLYRAAGPAGGGGLGAAGLRPR